MKENVKNSNKRIRQFTTLAKLGTILNSTLDKKEVRRMAMEAATSLMNCEVSSLLLLDPDSNELYFEVALGDGEEKLKEIRLKEGEGIAGWVSMHDEPLLITDVSKDPRHFKSVDKKSNFTTRDMLCVPLKVKDTVIGVLQAINKLDEEVFNDEDMELFQLFANQVAIAVDNARLYEELQDAFLQTSEALADAIDKRDPYTGGHTKRVVKYSMAIAKYLNMNPNEEEHLKVAAILHDIGKIGIEDVILRKPSKLNEDEFNEIKKHPKFGCEIMGKVSHLKDVIPGMRFHHERIDGKGYPDGLNGNTIPLIAKIIAVADTFDAMTSDRPYRKGLDCDVAIEEIKRVSGFQCDEVVVGAFTKACNNGEIVEILEDK
ncbi:MAG: HD domain-containing phosphohydrolase [Pseudomonadota bacterium]